MTDMSERVNRPKTVGIYIHVPFCRSKCHYCDFCSFTGLDGVIDGYVDALCRDIESFKAEPQGYPSRRYTAETVYFGGGTPTLLDTEHFEKILETVDRRFNIEDNAEISAECNPGTVDAKKLCGIRRAGVNRLSIGLQSVHDDELKMLGRIHTYNDFLKTLDDAWRAGFENVSADLMYGIPGQSMSSWAKTLEEVGSMNLKHISAYGLKIEEHTGFFENPDGLTFPDEDTVCDMYEYMRDKLRQMGYNRYEISNFARQGFESVHNLKYWLYEDYIGFGPSAHSFLNRVRTENSRDLKAYLKGENICVSSSLIGECEAMNEYVMLRMRLEEGVDKKTFFDKFGVDFDSRFSEKFNHYAPGFVINGEKSCRFTDRGFLLSNYILSDVLNFEEM